MKSTIIGDVTVPSAPESGLYRYIGAATDSVGEIVIARRKGDAAMATVVHSVTPVYPVGHVYTDFKSDLKSGHWVIISSPVTIKFEP